MKDRMTEAAAAVELGIPLHTLQNIRRTYDDHPDWSFPPRVGRDRIYLPSDVELLRPLIEDWLATPTERWVCARCRRPVRNVRKLHQVGDCRLHGGQVQAVVRLTQYRGVRQKDSSEYKRALTEIDAVTAEAGTG